MRNQGRIRLMNHCGDQDIATFEIATEAGITVAQSALTEFLEKCIKDHGKTLPVFRKRINDDSGFAPVPIEVNDNRVNISRQYIEDTEEFLLGYPLVGG